MGLDIKRNAKGEYQLKSTVSDESYHPEKKWVTEDEAKTLLIHRKLWQFIEECIEIDMTFPNGYHVNDKFHRDETKPDFNQFMIDAYRSKEIDATINNKFKEVYKRLNLKFTIKP